MVVLELQLERSIISVIPKSCTIPRTDRDYRGSRTIKFLEPKGYIVVPRPLEVGKFLSLKV
jgi:hypothetical protein